MIKYDRLKTITKEFVNHLSEALRNDEELYMVLSEGIGLTDNEIDILCSNFDYDREGFDYD